MTVDCLHIKDLMLIERNHRLQTDLEFFSASFLKCDLKWDSNMNAVKWNRRMILCLFSMQLNQEKWAAKSWAFVAEKILTDFPISLFWIWNETGHFYFTAQILQPWIMNFILQWIIWLLEVYNMSLLVIINPLSPF